MTQNEQVITDARAKLLPRITGWFFDRPWLTVTIWLVVTVFGILSYTTFLRREGFPSINIPIVIVNGSYAVNDPARVDNALAPVVSETALRQAGVKSVNTTSDANFFSAVVQYNEGTDSNRAKDSLQQALTNNPQVPKSANLTFSAPYFGVTGPSSQKIDATVAVYSTDHSKDLQALTADASKAVAYLNQQHLAYVDNFFVIDPFQQVVSPLNGQKVTVQRSFDRYIERDGNAVNAYPSVVIGVAAKQGADVIKLDNEIHQQLAKLQSQPGFSDVRTTVTASYAPSIKDQISELQRVLLEGLAAVLIVGSIVIAVRASLITVVSMVTVISIALGVIHLLGYSLNVITLFALILGLSLIVDDTIIMVEAIDAARRHNTDRRVAVREAAQKIGRAMIAATLTATLSFLPLVFVSGILGSFIRAIPVTIISALLVSLVAALLFIPLFARYVLLGKKQMGEGKVREVAAGFEARIARGISRPMLWARHHRGREFFVGLTAVFISLVFIGAGGVIFQKVPFNIFPPSKDTNEIAVDLTFPASTTITQAETIADHVDAQASSIIGSNLRYASYYGQASNRTATLYMELVPYGTRAKTAPQMAADINAGLADAPGVKVAARSVDIVPASQFTVNIDATNRLAAEKLAADMTSYLQGVTLMRTSGKLAHFTSVSLENTSVYRRSDGKPILSVTASFDGSDTSTLTTLAQKAITDHYTAARLQQFGLQPSDIDFNIGQESENQNSFKSLLLAFPLVLLAIYLLLLIQFRSFLQPLLIFMALPFSFFGIALGLYLSNNPFSFFAMLGFFALIGLSIKNTILLTDYANQARRAGRSPVDAAVGALGERFRPLVATSLTAVFSLIPLAVTSPFWQGLAVVLIFGLLSSTLLVIFVFPYYYLGGEYMRIKSRNLWHRIKR